jgi:sugar phosphate permease
MGVGMALSWVPMTIASLAGVSPADAGIASGITNTARQVGGALGLAVVTTIASSKSGETSAALAHGFHESFVVLFGLVVVALGVTIVFLHDRRPATANVESERDDDVVLVEAA